MQVRNTTTLSALSQGETFTPAAERQAEKAKAARKRDITFGVGYGAKKGRHVAHRYESAFRHYWCWEEGEAKQRLFAAKAPQADFGDLEVAEEAPATAPQGLLVAVENLSTFVPPAAPIAASVMADDMSASDEVGEWLEPFDLEPEKGEKDAVLALFREETERPIAPSAPPLRRGEALGSYAHDRRWGRGVDPRRFEHGYAEA